LFSFLVFVGFYMAILFLQRSASEAFELTSTLKANLIPEDAELKGSADVRDWIADVVTTTWQDARCGDGRCEAPFEYPEYGRFGCKADCDLLQQAARITPIQIDIYYNFSHPRGSVSPIDLMKDAAWNLCPMEVDELIGPKKIFHGSDCYYEEDQKFEEQVGHVVREIDDVPDGDWSVVLKKDIFLKVAGAVRPRMNVTLEAKNKRLLLAAHYGQIRRKYEVQTYAAIKTHLSKSNLTLAHDLLLLNEMIENRTLLTANATAAAKDPPETYDWDGNQTALIAKFTLNRTMVNFSLAAGSECALNFVKEEYLNVTDYSTSPITLHNASWMYSQKSLQSACSCVAGAENASDPATYCYCYGPDSTTNPNSVADPVLGANLSYAAARRRACTETMRWILLGSSTSSWQRHLDRAWYLNAVAQTDAAAVADAEMNSVMSWLSRISPVTFFEINQIRGTDASKLDEASLDTLKNDNVLSERASDGNASALTNAARKAFPYYEQLITLIDNRLRNVNVSYLVTPLYLSPPVLPFNFTYMLPGGLAIADKRYPEENVHAQIDVDIVEWNPAVLARQEYAFMTCNLESRAEQYVGSCKKPSDVSEIGPFVANPSVVNGAKNEAYLTQKRFQTLCESICYCSEVGVDGAGNEVTRVGCSAIAGDGSFCSCDVCENPAQFDNVVYPVNTTAVSGRKLLAHGGESVEDALARSSKTDWAASHRRRLLESGPSTARRGNKGRSPRRQLLATDLDAILTAVQDLATKQRTIDTNIASVRAAQNVANSNAEKHHSDTSLETIIKAGFDDLKKGTDSLSTSLEEILAKQQQALASAQESLSIQLRTNALAESAERAITRLEQAVERQKISMNAAYLNGAFADVAQYVAIQEDAVVTRERKAKENVLMNSPCQMKVLYYSFTLDNFENPDPVMAYRERFIGLNNRVLAGMLVYVERKNLVKCPSSRFDAIDATCSSGRDVQSYGVDPVFKLGTPLYVADYDNVETLTKVYNCSSLESTLDGFSATYNDGSVPGEHGNFPPYCLELFNSRDIPYGFRHKSFPGYDAGFPYFFDINLSADEAQRWIDVMNYGLMIDDVKTEKVTAQIVVYNAELGYFGNVMVFFEFNEGGKVLVTHSVNTVRVEVYESEADMFRLGMEVVLCLGVAWSAYEELMDVFETKKQTGSYGAYFSSVWNYVDVASISLHVVTLMMWFTFGFSLAANFSPDIHYEIYKNLEASAFVASLKTPNQMAEMGAMFLEMKSLVEYLQLYMTFSGINIMLLLGRILKLMDFQPRLGVITHTLALATADLTHFFVIFAMIFMGYAFIGHVIFGYSSSHFADITASVNSLFQNLLGDITYFMEDFKAAQGLNFVVAMIYFYSFNIFVFMILFNFLLAIICDAFGEVKANASESVSVATELGPMLRDSWRTAFRSFYRDHVPEDRVRRQLKIWKGEDPDESDEDRVDEAVEKVIKYGDTKELDVAGLKRVLRRCVVETYQRSAESKFLLTNRSRGGGFFGTSKKNALATPAEIEAAADMLMNQVGVEPEGAQEDDDGPSELELLQGSLEKLLKAQQRLVEGQVKVIEGQAKMADRQERLSELEKNILGVLEKPPGGR